jgi:hypothetical protein
MDARGPLEELVARAQSASASFEEARDVNPEDEHAYVSEVQMLLKLLDHVRAFHAGGEAGGSAGRSGSRDAVVTDSLWTYLGSPKTDPYLREAVQHAEDLLDVLRRIRAGEHSSSYEQQCRAGLDALYGRHERALQTFDSLLSRPDIYRAPIRRQIVWTLLARASREDRGRAAGSRAFSSLNQRETDRVVGLLEENLRDEPHNGRDLRLWVQAVRRSKHPPTLEAVIEKLGYWKASANSLDAVFYLYVFNVLRALEGSALARDEAIRFVEECKSMARFRRNRTRELEWLGAGEGVGALIADADLPDRGSDGDGSAGSALRRVSGRIVRIFGPQAGQAEIAGVPAFFVPARGNFAKGRSENQLIEWVVGFSYDGIQARPAREGRPSDESS